MLPLERVTVSVGDDGFAKFGGSEVQYLSDTGEPAIPYMIVRTLLPPEADPATAVAAVKNRRFEEQPGTWQIRPTPQRGYENSRQGAGRLAGGPNPL